MEFATKGMKQTNHCKESTDARSYYRWKEQTDVDIWKTVCQAKKAEQKRNCLWTYAHVQFLEFFLFFTSVIALTSENINSQQRGVLLHKMLLVILCDLFTSFDLLLIAQCES